jgi:flagellar hook-associated protein 1 FlgK
MSLFGYYYIGLQSMSAARLGLQVAGDNIANVNTPGYARRRLELTPGFPVSIRGGMLDQGVDVAGLRRMQDHFLQTSMERELGKQAGSEELLRGLEQLESVFGTIDGQGGIAAALAEFAAAFDSLAAQPESLALRRGAISASQALAGAIRDAHQRLSERRSVEDQAAGVMIDRINALASELASLNREIAAEEAGGGVAAPLRDKRAMVIEELTELTGGSSATGEDGRVSFSLPGGPTLVTGDDALLLTTSRASDGTLRVHSGADGRDITDAVRDGRLGSKLYLRDEAITDHITDLNRFAAHIVTQANAMTTSATDLNGNAGQMLFAPAFLPGIASRIQVNDVILDDPSLLAVSGSGAPADGSIAMQLASLADEPAAGLGDRSVSAFFADMVSRLGSDVVRADVAHGVASSLVESMQARQDAISGVSLDEEAVELMRNQEAYEAAARFIQVLNSVTEVAINLVNR